MRHRFASSIVFLLGIGLAGLWLAGCTVGQTPPAVPAATLVPPPAITATPTPAAPSGAAQVPPDEPTPLPDLTPAPIDLGQSPARPTPGYFPAPDEPLLPGVVSGTINALSPPAGPALLYLDGSLHVWRPAEERDEDLGWPDVALDCAWLAPDGQTLYLADTEGVKRVDLQAGGAIEPVLAHFVQDENPARHRRFCVTDLSGGGSKLLLQARDAYWYQWGILDRADMSLRVVESPFGPAGEPWHCPGAAILGQDDVLFVTGYSSGKCNQFPGFHITRWGAPLVPTPVVTSTLPARNQRPIQHGGAWMPVRSPDGATIAFWLDEDWALPGSENYFERALYLIDADGNNPRRLAGPVANAGGQPVWSADGKALYYASASRLDSIEPQVWQIHRVDTASGEDQILHELVARHVLTFGAEQDELIGLLLLNDELVYQLHLFNLASGELTFGPTQVIPLGWLK